MKLTLPLSLHIRSPYYRPHESAREPFVHCHAARQERETDTLELDSTRAWVTVYIYTRRKTRRKKEEGRRRKGTMTTKTTSSTTGDHTHTYIQSRRARVYIVKYDNAFATLVYTGANERFFRLSLSRAPPFCFCPRVLTFCFPALVNPAVIYGIKEYRARSAD